VVGKVVLSVAMSKTIDMLTNTRLARLKAPLKIFTTTTLSHIEYETTEEAIAAKFFASGRREQVAELRIPFVSISFYAKQHLLKKPDLLDCGVIIESGSVEKYLIPSGRTRMAGNGSVAVKYIDLAKPVPEDEVEKYERVGIRPPDGVFTYAFFEASYLARSEDPRRGALFLIDPSMIVLQQPMTAEQKKEFETFGGRKVLYFDVLGAPNLQERREEIKRCRMRGEIRRMQYEEADKKWEDEMQDRVEMKEIEDQDKPKLSKKAKQKARQNAKTGKGGAADEEEKEREAEAERLHKQKQAESKAKQEEDVRQEKEVEVNRKKTEAAEAKREAENEARAMGRMKSLLQKLSTSLTSKKKDDPAEEEAGKAIHEVVDESAEESSDDDVPLRRQGKAAGSASDAAGYPA